jgi:hypothetical protein
VKYLSFQLSGNETFTGNLPVLAADLNRDGKQDLVIAAVSPTYAPGDPYDEGPQDLYLLEGDGTGGFAAAKSIYSIPQDVAFDTYAFGDFDGDDNADLVFTTTPFPNPFVSGGNWNLHVLFGDGTGGFEDHLLATSDSWRTLPALGTGDLNGDGRTDFFLLGKVYLGQRDRTFTVETSNVPDLNQISFAMADFNDDGRMDLVSYGSSANDYNACCAYLVLQLGSDPPGTFTSQLIQLPVSLNGASPVVVGNFNDDAKPDVAVGQYEPAAAYVAPQITTAINSTSHGLWSNCPYPMGARKIVVCSPNQYAPGQVSFDASASSFGMLRKMELWVDGNKVAEQHNVWEDVGWLKFNAPVASGTHHASLYTGDVDHTLNRLDFAFTVGNDGCSSPAEPGVNICKPWADSFVHSPTTVQASANLPGTLARLEIWVDGSKKFTETASTWLDVALEMRSGKHAFTVIAVNTAGSTWEKTVTATVP